MLDKHSKRSRKPLDWTPECDEAFHAIKENLAQATLLAYPDTNSPLSLMVDASDGAIGGVVQEFKDNAWQPISFFSRKLLPAEMRYSTFGRELLAVYLTIKHFRYMLDGRHFCVFTDHKPLIHAFRVRPDRHNPREIRHLAYISQFTTDMRQVNGTDNVVADVFSRPDSNALHTDTQIDFGIIAQAQQNDYELQTLLNSNQPPGMALQKVPLVATCREIVCDVSHHIVGSHPNRRIRKFRVRIIFRDNRVWSLPIFSIMIATILYLAFPIIFVVRQTLILTLTCDVFIELYC